MIFKLTKASDWGFETTVEINTMEDLMDFCKECGQLIVSTTSEGKPALKIYDDYIE